MQIGPFVAERQVGEGGSARVFAARRGDNVVALKVAHTDAFQKPRDRDRFLEEARLLGRLKHPGVIDVIESGILPTGQAYLAMPLLAGETLASRLERGRLPLGDALNLLDSIASALDAVHAAGLVHRDVKPENVFLVSTTGQPILLDLGIARTQGAAASTLTRQGVVRGTASLMAPERFFGSPPNIASDVYELAALFFLAVVGAAPWEGGDTIESRLFSRTPRELGVPLADGLEIEMMAALSTRLEKRPSSAGEFAKRIRTAAG